MSKDREAIKNYREYLRLYLGDNYQADTSVSNKTAGKYEYVCLCLCVLYHKLKEEKAALRYAKKISSEKVFRQAIRRLLKSMLTAVSLSGCGSFIRKRSKKVKMLLLMPFYRFGKYFG